MALAVAIGPVSVAVAAPATEPEVIVVSSSRSPQPAARTGSSITVISGADLERSQLISIADALRVVPGVSINRNGGLGSVTSVRIRGAEAEQTVVLVDGIKLSDPSQPGGGQDFAGLLTGEIERIEVLRGPQSTLYGSEALGGVVAITTRSGQDGRATTLDLEGGDLGTGLARGAVHGALGPIGYALAASTLKTDGISAADVGTEADSFENTSARARATWQAAPTLQLEAQAWLSASDVGIDGFAPPTFAFGDTPERSITDQTILALGARLSALPDDRLRTRLLLSQAKTERRLEDPSSPVPTTFTARGVLDAITLQTDFDLSPHARLTGGYEREQASIRTTSPSVFDPSPVPFVVDVVTQAVFVEAALTPTNWLNVTMGARRSDHSRFGEALNLRTTFVAALPDQRTRVRGVLADGFKAPSLFQLASEFGNARLVPEEATSAEIGIEREFGEHNQLVASATWFQRDTVNQIDFVSCFGATAPLCIDRPWGTYDNVARTRADGVEALVRWQPMGAWTFQLGHTSLRARNRAANSPNFDKDLPRRPRTTTSLDIIARPVSGLELGASILSVGSSFDNASNTRRLAAYTLVNLTARQALGDVWSVVARIENAGDARYQTASFYNSLPRQITVGLHARF